jgi:hypothetical protein
MRSDPSSCVRAFSHMRERLAKQCGHDAEALGDESVEYGLEGGHHSRLPCLNEYAERSAHGQATFLCHLCGRHTRR